MSLLRRWWASPADYAWSVRYHVTNEFLSNARSLIGLWCWLFGVVCVLVTLTDSGAPRGIERGVVLVLAVSTFVVGALWMSWRWPTETLSRVFLVYAEIGIAVVLLILADPLVSLPCATAFGVVGGYIAAFHGPRIFLAHQGWACAVSVVLFVRSLADPETDPALASIYMVLLTLVLFSAPFLTQALVMLLRLDASAAFFDPLTGLRNRRGLDAGVSEIRADAGPVSVVVIDLDDFKRINDRYGHSHGDVVLRRTAAAVLEAFGPHAVSARTGGEEFQVVAVGAPVEVVARAGSLRSVLADYAASTTASIGIAHCDAGTLVTNAERVVARADAAMYAAKGRGGNALVEDEKV